MSQPALMLDAHARAGVYATLPLACDAAALAFLRRPICGPTGAFDAVYHLRPLHVTGGVEDQVIKSYMMTIHYGRSTNMACTPER